MEIYYQDKNLIIRPLQEEDCGVFAEGFAAQGWNKPLCQFQKYLEEQKAGSRKVVAAQWQGRSGWLCHVAAQGPGRSLCGERLARDYRFQCAAEIPAKGYRK